MDGTVQLIKVLQHGVREGVFGPLGQELLQQTEASCKVYLESCTWIVHGSHTILEGACPPDDCICIRGRHVSHRHFGHEKEGSVCSVNFDPQ